jgi:peptidoglycan/xylan/chitin deacetylase (PgdA/CDA1 family)
LNRKLITITAGFIQNFRPCFFAGFLYPEAIFRIKTNEKLLYLTFDDGPHPVSTPQLLDILDLYNIKALFFSDGRAAGKYPHLIEQIISKGHIIGNHGYSHLNGWKTSTEQYITDIEKAAPLTSERLFRPPYGRLRLSQYRLLKEKYKIVFWDLMPYDFDRSFGSEISMKILKERIRPGSIIVLHDAPGSTGNSILGEFLNFAVVGGYRFEFPV